MNHERPSDADWDRADAALWLFEVDDAAIETAAAGAGTVPASS